MSEQTSEKWEVFEDSADYIIFNGEQGSEQFAIAYVPKGTLPEREKHARLIAAAPALLEACKSACEYYEMLEGATGVEHPVLSELREAIAKAKDGG